MVTTMGQEPTVRLDLTGLGEAARQMPPSFPAFPHTRRNNGVVID